MCDTVCHNVRRNFFFLFINFGKQLWRRFFEKETIKILSGSENKELSDIISECSKKTGVGIEMTYKGSVDIKGKNLCIYYYDDEEILIKGCISSIIMDDSV